MVKFRVGVIAVLVAACGTTSEEEIATQAALGNYCNAQMPQVQIWNGTQPVAAKPDEIWVMWPYTSQQSLAPNQTVAALVNVTDAKIHAANVMDNAKAPNYWRMVAPRIGGPGGNPPPPPCDINPLCAKQIVAYGMIVHNAVAESQAMVAGCPK